MRAHIHDGEWCELCVEHGRLIDWQRLERALKAAADGLSEQGITTPNAAVLAQVVAAEYQLDGEVTE